MIFTWVYVIRYRKSSRYQKIGYEEQFAAYCNILLSDVNKRIERGHVRLQLNKQSAEETANAVSYKLYNLLLFII